MSEPDRSFGVRIPMTREQRREIVRRAGLGPWEGRALAEYITGCLFGEPEPELLARVRAVSDREREQFRADLLAMAEEHVRRSTGANRERAERRLASLREREKARAMARPPASDQLAA